MTGSILSTRVRAESYAYPPITKYTSDTFLWKEAYNSAHTFISDEKFATTFS